MPVTDLAAPLQSPQVSLSWTPTSGAVSFVLNGNTYPYAHQADAATRSTDANYQAVYTPAYTPVTFTAVAVVDPKAAVVEYRWDFGDGTIGFGASVIHTFTVPNKHTAVSVVVKDSFSQTGSATAALNLIIATTITVRPMLQA